jgi:cardiolipin synthase
VHVLLDWLGSNKMDPDSIAAMEERAYRSPAITPCAVYNLHRFNNRTHRKLLIVDGRIGFTGGVGIADQWTGHAQDPDHWRDSHYRVEARW